jgi:hypothetical protein
MKPHCASLVAQLVNERIVDDGLRKLRGAYKRLMIRVLIFAELVLHRS